MPQKFDTFDSDHRSFKDSITKESIERETDQRLDALRDVEEQESQRTAAWILGLPSLDPTARFDSRSASVAAIEKAHARRCGG